MEPTDSQFWGVSSNVKFHGTKIMNYPHHLTACVLLTFITLATPTLQGQDVAPPPPPVSGIEATPTPVGSPHLEAVPPVDSVSAPAIEPLPAQPCLTADADNCVAMDADSCCAFTPDATCCTACIYTCPCCGYPNCTMPGIHKRKKNGKLKWCRVWSTGDMYPHFAYYPAHHGTYYFRPYNYTNVLQHKAESLRMYGDYNSPYSNKIFDSIYDNYYAVNPQIVEPSPFELGIEGIETLPAIESFLDDAN